MEAITISILTGIVANACYSALQKSSTFSKKLVKDLIMQGVSKLKVDVPSEELIDPLINKLSLLPIDDECSEKKIINEIENNEEVYKILKKMEENCTTVSQSVTKIVEIHNTGIGSIRVRDINQ